MTTGQRMKEQRKKIGLSAERVADALGVSPATIYRYEKGDIEKVPGDILGPLADVLQTTPAALMGWEELQPAMLDIGERIKRRREELGISVEEVAKKLGKHRATIYRYESDEIRTFPRDVLAPLAAVLQTTPAALMGWEEFQPAMPDNVMPMPQMRQIPLVGTIACGQPITAVEAVEDIIEIPEHIHADFALRCKGDSMINARIYDGDIVYIRQQPKVENGEIAAVLIEDGAEYGEATLKRVYLSPGQLVLQAENPQFAPLVFVGDDMNHVRIMGKAIAFTSTIKH